jgi:hypothetical protein
MYNNCVGSLYLSQWSRAIGVIAVGDCGGPRGTYSARGVHVCGRFRKVLCH